MKNRWLLKTILLTNILFIYGGGGCSTSSSTDVCEVVEERSNHQTEERRKIELEVESLPLRHVGLIYNRCTTTEWLPRHVPTHLRVYYRQCIFNRYEENHIAIEKVLRAISQEDVRTALMMPVARQRRLERVARRALYRHQSLPANIKLAEFKKKKDDTPESSVAFSVKQD